MSDARTLHDKLWDDHCIALLKDGTELLHIDRIVLHERFAMLLPKLRAAGRPFFDPSSVYGVMDHVVDTVPGRTDDVMIPKGREFIEAFREGAGIFGYELFDVGDVRQGITHVTMPEQGLALPGMSLVCADSHTGTMGGIGALAWGVGATEMEHVLLTQTLAISRPKSMRVQIDGRLGAATSAKDIVLALIGKIGANGGTGYMVEYAGEAIRALPVEARMTLCNMGVEFGAWASIVAPDDITIDYVRTRPSAPRGRDWEVAVDYWRELRSDDGAVFDREIIFSIEDLAPQVTWGTSPQHVASVAGFVPKLESIDDLVERQAAETALDYMGLRPGQRLADVRIDAVFIGSCTNARITDLRSAAAVLRGRQIAPHICKAIVVPGSSAVKAQAEAEGLDRIFRDAGFEWRESGCSLCFFGGGEAFPPGSRVASTTNRNFENRQGPGIRTHIMSPATAAASSVAGTIADSRSMSA